MPNQIIWLDMVAKVKKPKKVKAVTKKISLALQGGGSHGAFTWGVLDRILEDDRLEIDVISGTSAGAINGACVSYGMEIGGRAKAREVLDSFWSKISETARYSPMQPTAWDKMYGNHAMDFSPGFVAADYMSRMFSPYQLNFLDYNPMRDVLARLIDFKKISSSCKIKLYINATNVLKGKIKIFKPEEITIDSVMASACLPHVFKTVEIKGEYYWDGGYSGNPSLFPLFEHAKCQDIIIVQINPLSIDNVPLSAVEIMDRINEISFNQSLMDEMRSLYFVNKLLHQGKISHDDYRDIRIHMVDAGNITKDLGSSSKMNLDWDFISYLHDEGRKGAEAWIKKNFDKLGTKSTVDIKEKFL